MNEEDAARGTIGTLRFLNTPGGRAYWAFARAHYSSEFQDFIDERIDPPS